MTFSSVTGLMSQFSENLLEAGLVSRASECQRPSSLYNEHSSQNELLKAVLLAGLYPNLIQVCVRLWHSSLFAGLPHRAGSSLHKMKWRDIRADGLNLLCFLHLY